MLSGENRKISSYINFENWLKELNFGDTQRNYVYQFKRFLEWAETTPEELVAELARATVTENLGTLRAFGSVTKVWQLYYMHSIEQVNILSVNGWQEDVK